jgi:hypothetical protein
MRFAGRKPGAVVEAFFAQVEGATLSPKPAANPLHKKRLRVMPFAGVWKVADRLADMVGAKKSL